MIDLSFVKEMWRKFDLPSFVAEDATRRFFYVSMARRNDKYRNMAYVPSYWLTNDSMTSKERVRVMGRKMDASFFIVKNGIPIECHFRDYGPKKWHLIKM